MITAGHVTGTAGTGIYARGYGTGITIQTASVSGGTCGVKALNDGSGPLSITSSGTISGGSGQGVNAYNKGGSLTISAAGVTGAQGGISAFNNAGALTKP